MQELTNLYLAATLIEAEGMRKARNSCRQFMTGNQREISIDEQEHWFKLIDRTLIRPYVFYWQGHTRAEALIIGYGLVRADQGKWWVSGGLLPEWRGQGHGKKLFESLANVVNNEIAQTCWLDVFEDNAPAVRTYKSLGFVDVSASLDGASNRAILTMKRDRK